LLLAAGELVAEMPRRSCSCGKNENTARASTDSSSRAVRRGGDQILAHREIWENLPPFGHEPDAGLGNAVRGQAAHFPSVEHDRAAREATTPMIESTVVVFPMPLRPSSVTTSPGPIANDTPNSTWLKP
jgi:hypothetical protein